LWSELSSPPRYSPLLAFRQDGCLYLSCVLIERECNDALRPLQYRGQHLLPWWPIIVSTVLVNSSHWSTLKINNATDYSKRFNSRLPWIPHVKSLEVCVMCIWTHMNKHENRSQCIRLSDKVLNGYFTQKLNHKSFHSWTNSPSKLYLPLESSGIILRWTNDCVCIEDFSVSDLWCLFSSNQCF